jgi:hypothetical protein
MDKRIVFPIIMLTLISATVFVLAEVFARIAGGAPGGGTLTHKYPKIFAN